MTFIDTGTKKGLIRVTQTESNRRTLLTRVMKQENETEHVNTRLKGHSKIITSTTSLNLPEILICMTIF